MISSHTAKSRICSVIRLDKRVYHSSRAGRERLVTDPEAGSLRFSFQQRPARAALPRAGVADHTTLCDGCSLPRGADGRQRGATGPGGPVRPGVACDDRGHAWGPSVFVASSPVFEGELPRLGSRWRAKRAGFSVACWRLDSPCDPCRRARPLPSP